MPELRRIGEIAAGMGRKAPVALRVNPDVAAGTHDRISTGRRDDKFGIAYDRALEVYRLAAGLDGIEPVGLHLHIGSQITRLEPFGRPTRAASSCSGTCGRPASPCAVSTSAAASVSATATSGPSTRPSSPPWSTV